MRGVLRYRGEGVVGILDSTRAGETEQGYPIVGDVESALALNPTSHSSVSLRKAVASRPPGRKVLRDCVERGISVENGLHEFIPRRPELGAARGRAPERR
jgi:uncharacterized NAD-dependent epimerase/dehydratase family protein